MERMTTAHVDVETADILRVAIPHRRLLQRQLLKTPSKVLSTGILECQNFGKAHRRLCPWLEKRPMLVSLALKDLLGKAGGARRKAKQALINLWVSEDRQE
jgi:hypothetical protein